VWGYKEYETDFAPISVSVKCPVLVITGDKDYAIGTEHYKSFRFPRQKVVHYIGGHAPFQEEPQWFAEKIIDFTSTL
jgi:proline iminopeptidase